MTLFAPLCHLHSLCLSVFCLPVFKLSALLLVTMAVTVAMTALAGHMESHQYVAMTGDILV